MHLYKPALRVACKMSRAADSAVLKYETFSDTEIDAVGYYNIQYCLYTYYAYIHAYMQSGKSSAESEISDFRFLSIINAYIACLHYIMLILMKEG